MNRVQVMKELFACYVLGDTPGVLALTHPDAETRFPGDPTLVPWAGTYVGHDIERFMERVKDNVDILQYTAYRFEAAGDHVLVFAREHCRAKTTGKLYVNEHIGIGTVRDGLVVRYLEYSDTARLQAAFTD